MAAGMAGGRGEGQREADNPVLVGVLPFHLSSTVNSKTICFESQMKLFKDLLGSKETVSTVYKRFQF